MRGEGAGTGTGDRARRGKGATTPGAGLLCGGWWFGRAGRLVPKDEDLPLHLGKDTPWGLVPGDDHDVEHRCRRSARKAPEGFPYPSLDPVALDRLLGHPLADRDPEPGAPAATLLPKDDQVPGGKSTAVLLDGLVLRAPVQPGPSRQGLLGTTVCPLGWGHSGDSWARTLLLRCAHDEAFTASCAPSRKHQPAVLGLHPAPEPVGALSALVVRLIWALHGLGSSSWTCMSRVALNTKGSQYCQGDCSLAKPGGE